MSRVVITGPSGGAVCRLEINDFVRNEKFFSLYIQALRQVYDTSESDDQSFFQIGGIHGVPYTPWNNATGDASALYIVPIKTRWDGYCVHGSVLFPTWHRPYVMLFEQTIQTKAKAIAATYTVDKAAWKKAAEDLRQPYWDWAANIIPPDEVIAMEHVRITGPNGRRITVPNPLFKYTFHTRPKGFPSPFNRWTTTYRHPSDMGPNPTTNIKRLREALLSYQNAARTDVYRMLVFIRTWQAFSNHSAGDDGSGTNSLESIHDQIHKVVGGKNGQMADPSVAGFDPIFFLHHANVDRLLALWAAINPSVWVTPGNSNKGTFTLSPKSPVDTNTPLTPFWNTQNYESFWASYSTRKMTTLGYTYPEFDGLDLENPTAVRTAIVRTVNRLYSGGFSPIMGPSLTEQPMATGEAKDTPEAALAAERSAPVPVSLPAAIPVDPNVGGSVVWAWTARVEFEKYELNSAFSIYFFLGPVPENPDDWLTSPSCVGMHYAFVGSAAESCANCRDAAERGLIQQGFVHLDEGIVRLSGLDNLQPGVVDPWLEEHLTWRVEKADGTEAILDTLEVTVFARPLSYPTGADFPVAGEMRFFNHVTYGKVGGSRSA